MSILTSEIVAFLAFVVPPHTKTPSQVIYIWRHSPTMFRLVQLGSTQTLHRCVPLADAVVFTCRKCLVIELIHLLDNPKMDLAVDTGIRWYETY